MAKEIDSNMHFELKDIIQRREENLRLYSKFWPIKKKKKH
jgi:hypothetical protein